jgi:hypothetical protein
MGASDKGDLGEDPQDIKDATLPVQEIAETLSKSGSEEHGEPDEDELIFSILIRSSGWLLKRRPLVESNRSLDSIL